jgi:fumarate reductase flavoprotein subunit
MRKGYFVNIVTILLAMCFSILGGSQLLWAQSKPLEADIVIIGGGGAGAVAALTAIQDGAKKVILLEKQAYLGGTSATAGGQVWAAETHLQKAAGVASSKEDFFNEHMKANNNERVDSKVVRAFIDQSAETMKWLEDNGILYMATWGDTHMPADDTGNVANFGRTIDKLAAKFKDKGGKILLDTKAQKIMRDTEGKISGVIATDSKGEALVINTKTVILATGGFNGNEELLKKYFPDKWQSGGIWKTEAVQTNTGDGIKLAEDAGAAINEYATLIDHLNYTFFDGENNYSNRLGMQSANIEVNKRGERVQGDRVQLSQPDQTIYFLFDDKMVGNINKRLKSEGQERDLKEFYKKYDQQQSWVKISSNWDDIARWIGADPEVLKATVAEYNVSCERGYEAKNAEKGLMPPMPVKSAAGAAKQGEAGEKTTDSTGVGGMGMNLKMVEPLVNGPFYAIKCTPLILDTYGPVRINENMQVIDKEGKPIPGFYAGGAICGGIQGEMYHGGGSALGFAIHSGRIAGRNAVKYISGK